MGYATFEEMRKIVRAFENGSITRENWRHHEHLTIAVYYAFHFEYETALNKMRGGIFNLLRSFKIDLTVEMPYHETLTVFWMRTIFDFLKKETGDLSIEAANKILDVCADKNLPLKFYRRERLFSDEARETYLEPDFSL